MSTKKFFIADTHFGDENLRLFENRPYKNTAEMDRVMIENWNRVVSAEDEVYLIGDMGADGHERELLASLNGIKYLVRGNHETETNNYYRECGFCEVYDKPVILDSFWILSHEPLYVSENMPYANIFGHVHASPIYKDYSSHHICVSVERIDYTPISFEEIIKKVKNK